LNADDGSTARGGLERALSVSKEASGAIQGGGGSGGWEGKRSWKVLEKKPRFRGGEGKVSGGKGRIVSTMVADKSLSKGEEKKRGVVF